MQIFRTNVDSKSDAEEPPGSSGGVDEGMSNLNS